MSWKNMGSSIDDFLKGEGIFEEAQAVKEIVAWQLAEAMKKKKKISKNKMATLLKTSRSQVDRLLDPKNDITLGSLQRAAAMVGRRVNVELVQEEGLELFHDEAGQQNCLGLEPFDKARVAALLSTRIGRRFSLYASRSQTPLTRGISIKFRAVGHSTSKSRKDADRTVPARPRAAVAARR